MKNILVPIDFSAASHNASLYGASLASIFNAKLILLNIIPPAFVIDDEAAPSLIMSQSELREAHKNLVLKEIEILSKKHIVKIEGLVGEGSPTDIILKMANEKQADILVMGMKGKGKSNSFFGSTTTAVIRKSSLPVFVIPENAPYQSIDKIALASDFDADTEISQYTLLKNLAEKYNSSIQILNVEKNESVMSSERVAGKMETDLIFSNFSHSFHLVENKNVVEGINKFIEKNPANILAMMAHKHDVFERMFGKIHTKSMSYQTKIPLLVLKSI